MSKELEKLPTFNPITHSFTARNFPLILDQWCENTLSVIENIPEGTFCSSSKCPQCNFIKSLEQILRNRQLPSFPVEKELEGK